MTQKFDPTRRTLSAGAALALLGFPVIAIGGCGGGGGGTPAGPTPSTTGDVKGAVAGNHMAPHLALITAAQLDAGAALILDISNGFHSHTVTLTSAQVTEIAARTKVVVASSTDPHSDGSGAHRHSVEFN